MSIFRRFSTMIKSKLNAAVDRASDPAKEIELLVYDMEEELRRAKISLRDQLAQEKLLQKRTDEIYQNISRLEEAAKRAVLASDDETAKALLRRQRDEEHRLVEAEKNLAQQSQLVLRISDQLDLGKQKLNQVKARKESFKAHAENLKLDKQGESAFDRFDKLAEQIELAEFRSQAAQELAQQELQSGDAGTQASMNRLLSGRTADTEVEARLLELKKGALPPPDKNQ